MRTQTHKCHVGGSHIHPSVSTHEKAWVKAWLYNTLWVSCSSIEGKLETGQIHVEEQPAQCWDIGAIGIAWGPALRAACQVHLSRKRMFGSSEAHDDPEAR